MRVTLTSARCGHLPPKVKGGVKITFAQNEGQTVEVSDEEGRRMIDSGLAVPATAAPRNNEATNTAKREKRG